MRWINAARLRLLLLFARENAESRMMKEFGFHIEMETGRLMRDEHLAPDEARRRAMVAFGGVEKHKEELRDGRGLRWLGSFSLDLRLGFRMLRKYPGLTTIGILALSVGIGIGAAYMEGVNEMYRPVMPGEHGDRIVRLYRWDVAKRERDLHLLHDLELWRPNLKSLEEIGAFRQVERNLILADGDAAPVSAAEISASAFRLMGNQPLLGRTLRDDDELPNAPAVAVIGNSLWKSRFQGDPSVIGRTVRFDNVVHTIVGVMPDAFAFPMNQVFWTPFRMSASSYARGQEPLIGLFGRLKPGVDVEQAQTEITNINAQQASQLPTELRNSRPRITPYLRPDRLGGDALEVQIFYALNLLFIGLLGVCCANVATLVFARTATREAELTVRNALGASRGRIVVQLFAEALALTSVGALGGLVAAQIGLKWTVHRVAEVAGFQFPFWWNDNLSMTTIVYAMVLAVIAAIFIGVFPALKATGSQLQARLKLSAPGSSSMQFGKLWTGIIVAQVGFTVLFLFIITSVGWNAKIGRYLSETAVADTKQYLTFQPLLDESGLAADTVAGARTVRAERYKTAYEQLERRLLVEPGVKSVSHADLLPGMDSDGIHVEIDGIPNTTNNPDAFRIHKASVGITFFETFQSRVVAGRSFSSADVEFQRAVAVVDEQFVQRALHGRSPIGLRVRRVRNTETLPSSEWFEIVGVVQNLTRLHTSAIDNGKMYTPITAESGPVYIAVHVNGNPKAMTERVRRIAAQVDATMRLQEVVPMNEVGAGFRLVFDVINTVLMLMGGVALLLSTAGVYSLMSFTVSRRTREIGIRSALGADPRRIVRSTFSRGLRQIGIGVLAGSIPGFALVVYGAPEFAEGAGITTGGLMFAVIAAFVLSVGLLACLVPARRALSIQPTEALRAN